MLQLSDESLAPLVTFRLVIEEGVGSKPAIGPFPIPSIILCTSDLVWNTLPGHSECESVRFSELECDGPSYEIYLNNEKVDLFLMAQSLVGFNWIWELILNVWQVLGQSLE